MLITSVATLIVAAVALLGPLEQSLRNAEKATLKQELAGHAGHGRVRDSTVRSGQGGFYAKSSRPRPKTQSQGTGGASISPNVRKDNAREEALEQQYRDGVNVRAPWARRRAASCRPLGASEVALLGYADASGRAPSPWWSRPVSISPSGPV